MGLKRDLTKWGWICYHTKAVKNMCGENPKIRLLHPVGLSTFIFVVIAAPFVAMFTDATIQEIFSNYKSAICVF